MSTSELSNLASQPSAPVPPGDNSGGWWLGSQSVFEQKDERKLGRAMTVSIGIHAAVAALLLAAGIRQVVVAETQPPVKFDVVFLKEPGPGGGGGGSPAPAPPKKLEIPQPKAPEPLPMPEPVVAPPPIPTLNAPVTTASQLLQAQGTTSLSMAPVGGGGSGGGIGTGRGSGLGEGSGGGTGGGVYEVGNGVTNPTVIKQVDPSYTSDAMRAKIQGEVWLEAVVQPNGLLTDIKVVKSLDRQYGLDQAAIEAARKWLFAPGKKEGKPVPVRITVQMDFRLH
jgi:periplasmic protein TonB